MAEFSSTALQTVRTGQNVLFNNTVSCGRGNVIHRGGSGIFTLRGNTNQCFARYKVSFNGNIAVPTGVVPAALSLAIAIDGEPQYNATMIVTPTVAERFFNVSASTIVSVPCGCCTTVSVENTGTTAVSVGNANINITRIC